MTAHSPLVTIVIPTYNRSALLPITVRSALEQTYKNIEVIVVDDGSTDDTATVMKELMSQDPRLRYIHYLPNAGACVARNKGIDAASGSYICFLDSDDTYLPQKIERQIGVALSLPQGRDHIVQCQIAYLTNNNIQNTPPRQGKRIDENPADYIFLNGGQSHTPLCLINTGLARRVRFSDKLPKLQDFDWFIRLNSEDAEYAHIPESLATYRYTHDANQVSKRHPPFDIMNEWAKSIEHLLTPRSLAWLRANRLAVYASSENRWQMAARYLADGIQHGVVTPRRVVGVIGRTLLPKRIYQSIRPLIHPILDRS